MCHESSNLILFSFSFCFADLKLILYALVNRINYDIMFVFHTYPFYKWNFTLHRKKLFIVKSICWGEGMAGRYLRRLVFLEEYMNCIEKRIVYCEVHMLRGGEGWKVIEKTCISWRAYELHRKGNAPATTDLLNFLEVLKITVTSGTSLPDEYNSVQSIRRYLWLVKYSLLRFYDQKHSGQMHSKRVCYWPQNWLML